VTKPDEETLPLNNSSPILEEMTVLQSSGPLLLMLKSTRIIKNVPARLFSSPAVRPVNHYDILGVSHKSTQTEIKAMYYKLSKQYHPDVNKDDKNTENKFRKITEAYEVLGNLRLRKLYDRGLLPGGSYQSPAVEKEEMDSTDKTKYKRTRAQPSTGRTAIYDFDEWSRFHYSDAINRRNKAKEKYHQNIRDKTIEDGSRESENFILGIILSGFGLMLCKVWMTSESYDNVTPIKTKPAT